MKDSLVTIKIIEVKDSGKVYSEIKEPIKYINPFGPISYFSFNVNSPSDVGFLFFNMEGNILFSNLEENLPEGKYRIYFEDKFRKLQSGTYFYQIKIGDKTETKKIVLVK